METTTGILIRRIRWGDTSWITTWITLDHGKIRAVARGANRPKSRLAGKIDLFHHADITYSTPRAADGLAGLADVTLRTPFDASNVPVGNLFLGGYFAELVDQCTEPGVPVPEVFDLLLRAFGYLGRQPADRRALKHFETELCRAIGIHGGQGTAVAALESYCHRIPASRPVAWNLLRD